jgi:hypothetical protein
MLREEVRQGELKAVIVIIEEAVSEEKPRVKKNPTPSQRSRAY